MIKTDAGSRAQAYIHGGCSIELGLPAGVAAYSNAHMRVLQDWNDTLIAAVMNGRGKS